ncbi:hypothetical protein VKT23_002625 [Stygiomarasmius scandens]|uniref:Transcription elongation factor Eaf N-terminal domain-containing protein n=1 Tax=Marasmiellus scandens TaxID=2682957 RepID=A0ABR1K4G2_9AGAR
MASTSSSWTPLPGRHKVNVGSSLNRALRARKGSAPPPKRNNLPERDFYSVRYAFKPSSIDSTKPGSLEVKRGNDGNNITVEHPITQSEDAHVFSGNETAAKDWACVLIYDEESGAYTLEKLESFIALEHPDRKRASTTDRPPSLTSSSSNSKQATRQNSVDAEDLEDALLKSLKEDSEEEVPLAVSRPVSPKKAPAPTTSRPTKPAQSSKSRPQSNAAPSHLPAKPNPTPSTSHPKPKKSAKRATPTYSDEDIPISKPPEPKRTRRPSPPPPPEPRQSKLELPGSSTDYVQPLPAPSNPYTASTSSSKPSTSAPVQPPPPPPPAAGDSDSEEEDWDQVVGGDEEASAVGDIEMEEVLDPDAGEEIDPDLFGDLIEEHLGENENEPEVDFLAQGMASPEPEPPRITEPMSLSRYTGDVGDSEEDTSSSDDSDDE